MAATTVRRNHIEAAFPDSESSSQVSFRQPVPRFRARPTCVRTPGSPALLPRTPSIFPWLERRFSPGEATLWIGPDRPVSHLLETLYVGAVRAGGRISLIEGANRLHPYAVAETGRTLGLDPAKVLDRIRLARAFTAYQLVALVDGWAREARRSHPTLLVGHDLPALFETGELPPEERIPLLTQVARTLGQIVEEAGIPMLLTLPEGPARFPGLTDSGPRLFDVVRFRDGPDSLRLEAYRESVRLSLVSRPMGQRGLEEFDPGPSEEVIAWDAPPPPTGKHWRSG